MCRLPGAGILGPFMRRPVTTLVLAAYYLLQATWLLHSGMDLFLPVVRQAVAASMDSCCNTACGCPEDVKRVKGCCCDKSAPAQAARKSAPRSTIEEARCKGMEQAMSQAFTQPVVSAFALIPAPVHESTETILLEQHPRLTPTATSLEKVPIA